MDSAEQLARLLERKRRIVAFTGAGMSTESGIPDYRSPGGLWTQYAPIFYQDFLASAEARRESWERGLHTYAVIQDARPNAGHRALARLESWGVLLAVVTQNIDGLHQAAGSSPERVIELHGNTHRVRCLSCHARFERTEIHRRISAGESVPECEACGGILKVTTIAFGEPLNDRVLGAAILAAESCDCCIVVGSSLVVYPAAGIPERASMNGVPLVIVNNTATHLDGRADLVLRDSAAGLLEKAVALLGDVSAPH
jgi:NAD-dependent deacetylase